MAWRSRIKLYESNILKKVCEARNVVTLYLAKPSGFEYVAGQAISVDAKQFEPLRSLILERERATGKQDFPRAFSLSSSPLQSDISITVKMSDYQTPETKPILTHFLLNEINDGDKLQFSGVFGSYRLPDNYRSFSSVVYINAGSSIAPSHGIWTYLMVDSPAIRQYLYYQIPRFEDFIFKNEVCALNKKGILQTRIFLSRDKIGNELCSHGYISIPGKINNALYFVCGPNKAVVGREGFCSSIISKLKSYGVDDGSIITEKW